MSDTEYDNISDDDEDSGWMVKSSTAPGRFRGQNVPERWYPAHGRHAVPANRQRVQPVPATLNFHGDSIDGNSLCSGTFTIDLGTFQALQSRYQPAAVAVGQPPRYGTGRNTRRPHSVVTVHDADSAGYGRETEFRSARPYPQQQGLWADERQGYYKVSEPPRFRNGITTDNSRDSYRAAAGTQRDFSAERGYADQFQNRGDFVGREPNRYRYESASYDAFTRGYRCQGRDCRGCPSCANFADTGSLPRDDGYRQAPGFSGGFPGGERRDERGEMTAYGDPAYRDPVFRPPAADAGLLYSGSRVDERRENYRQQDRYDYVPIQDVPAPQMSSVSLQSRSQAAFYQDSRGEHAAESKQDTAHRRLLPTVNSDNSFQPVAGQEPTDGRTQTRSYAERGNYRPRSLSASRNESDFHPPLYLQPIQDQVRSGGGGITAEAPAANLEGQPATDQEVIDRQKQTGFYDKPVARPRSSSADRREPDLSYRSTYLQPRQNQIRDRGNPPDEFPASTPESQSFRATGDHRGDTGRETYSYSAQTKAQGSSIGQRSISGAVYSSASQRDARSQRDVPSSSSDFPDGRTSTERQPILFHDKPTARPRSSSADRQEPEFHPPANLQPRQEQVRDGGGLAEAFPTSSPEIQSFMAPSDLRGETRREDYTTSTPTKAPESIIRGRSSGGGRFPTGQDDSGSQCDASKEFRSSDGRRSAKKADEPDTKDRRSSLSEASGRRRDISGRRVKFQSDPELSHTEETSFRDSRRSESGSVRSETALSSGGEDQKCQSAELLRSSNAAENREEVTSEERRYSSQTSLPAYGGRSAPVGERRSQPWQRTRSMDRVDRSDRIRSGRSRDSSGDRQRVLPRAPIHQRRRAEKDETSSAIRDVTSELTRMTSSVKNIDSRPPTVEKRSSADSEIKVTGTVYLFIYYLIVFFSAVFHVCNCIGPQLFYSGAI